MHACGCCVYAYMHVLVHAACLPALAAHSLLVVVDAVCCGEHQVWLDEHAATCVVHACVQELKVAHAVQGGQQGLGWDHLGAGEQAGGATGLRTGPPRCRRAGRGGWRKPGWAGGGDLGVAGALDDTPWAGRGGIVWGQGF